MLSRSSRFFRTLCSRLRRRPKSCKNEAKAIKLKAQAKNVQGHAEGESGEKYSIPYAVKQHFYVQDLTAIC